MAQIQSFPCPQCGAQVAAGQRFCSNCGSTMDAGFSVPTAAASSGEHYAQEPPIPAELPVPPPPPVMPYQSPAQQPTNTYYPAQAPQSYSQMPQGQSYAPVPSYARPQKDSSKGVLGQIGCGVLLVILLIVGLCGGTAYLGYRWLAGAANSSTTNTGGSSSGKTPDVPLTSSNINQSVTYASAQITILSVQEGSPNHFTDDTSANSAVVLRVNINEQNPIADTIYLNYDNQARLILPDQSSVVPGSTQKSSILGQSVSQKNWIDFPLAKSIPIDQLTLQLGGQNEAQENIPLNGQANVSAYKIKTTSPNTSFQYAGLNWTLTTVTSNLSAGGKQADKGMRYIVVTLKVSNPTADTYYPNADNTMRLQAGSVTNAPTDSTFPSSIDSGENGKTGTATFLMPQNASTITLIMLGSTDTTPPISQYTTNFQI